ncbi:9689_t:CDS:2, partial [Dentiscutata heterogama]
MHSISIKQEDQSSYSKLSILQSCIPSDENQSMEIIAKPIVETKDRPEIKKEILIKEELSTLDYRVLESLEKDKKNTDKHPIRKSSKKAKKYKDIYNSCW